MRLTTRTGAAAVAALLVTLMAWSTSGPTVSADPGHRPTTPQPAGPLDAHALADKPNIVLITADDMRPGDLTAMPFTRTVVSRRGVRFTDAISPYTLCCPARAEIVTGQYSHNSGCAATSGPTVGIGR